MLYKPSHKPPALVCCAAGRNQQLPQEKLSLVTRAHMDPALKPEKG